MKLVANAVALVLSTLAAAMLLAACHEVPQNAAKPFAGKAETHLDDPKALALRAQTQNESSAWATFLRRLRRKNKMT